MSVGVSPLVNPETNELTKNESEQAEVLAYYFTSVFTKEPDGDIPMLQNKEVTSYLDETFITEDEVLKKINKLNPSK